MCFNATQSWVALHFTPYELFKDYLFCNMQNKAE